MKNAFAKSLFAIIFMLVLTASLRSQTTCEFSRQTSPVFLNLQLGMSPAQVQSVFGKSLKIKIKKDGEKIFFQNYIDKKAPEKLKNVRALYLRFFDQKLYQIEIFYEPNTAMPTLDAMLKRFENELTVPLENWKIENGYAQTFCGENSLKADYVLNPRVELTNEPLLKIVEDSRKTKENQ